MVKGKCKKPYTLTFMNIGRDIERYLDRYGTSDKLGFTPCIRGYGEEILAATVIAYGTRVCKPMPHSKMKSKGPLGQAWDEDGIEKLYPEVYDFYRKQGMS